jgi:hypothetical protein
MDIYIYGQGQDSRKPDLEREGTDNAGDGAIDPVIWYRTEGEATTQNMSSFNDPDAKKAARPEPGGQSQ